MYIEKEALLVKKVLGKKISTSLLRSSEEDASEKITDKEVAFWKEQRGYKIFESELYYESLLSSVLFHNFLIQNTLFFDNKTSYHYNQILLEFPQRFIYESNKTEGSQIPFAQLQLIFQQKQTLHTNKNEIQEVQNSLELWKFLQNDFVFNETHIKKVYHKLTKNLVRNTGDIYPRGYKKEDVVVNNSQTTPVPQVSLEIQKLLVWYKENKKVLFPLQLAFDFHLRFEQIHPFIDGNGRVGRMIMNKILLANGFLPCIVFSENRQAYFRAIASAESGRKKKYYTFMLEQYRKTLDIFHKNK